ncbi:L,D-transpeptidase family protein [Vibrio lentus]|uniref:L,D-TPase catalytic domain-containing protein n=1 Tax=Vibrio lentus TaxID=136468 RepID=A0AA45A7J5_9VIBR|nr:L,D-transpeptidase family protein [Vibrio lentus]MCB5361097.1 L,D-transpeptidase family protein [Vibrio lentus]MCB5451681.1 L,D-transpeptidase family protein [Vibrio lentus]MCB5462832.1 L,D-transpeptidase family protein [Vibrio lentus]MCC4794129.1 L,D-transpeptidase family protein [Vibrio lentus]MCC4852299.1 L,D-transpeptidase family protein [Vibrio lentus]
MRLFLPLSLCLLFASSLVYSATSFATDTPQYVKPPVVPKSEAQKLVVEKIVSDATAIETIVFESAPSHAQALSTSPASANSNNVIVVDDVLESGSDDNKNKVAQLSQGSSKRPPQSSSQQFYNVPNIASELDPLLQVVTLVKVDKSKRRMYLFKDDEVVQEFRIALGKQPKGHKRFEGDNRTPEGQYKLDYIMEESDFYRSVHINYPQSADKEWAEKHDLSPGGNIKIHGIKNGERRSPSFIQSFDWTDGCIALTNQDMDAFIELVKMGTPIHIEW